MPNIKTHCGVVAITGTTGFIGGRLVPFLEKRGYTVIRLLREPDKKSQGRLTRLYNVDNLESLKAALDEVDVFIHLAGASIGGLWTKKRKALIKDSRVNSTLAFAKAIEEMRNPPGVWVLASGLGYYGYTERAVDEMTPQGNGFLAEVVREWEEATKAVEKKIRVVYLRMGVVLNPEGGMLKRLISIFKWGLGISIGKGIFSWVSLRDALRAYVWVIEHESFSGPVNVVAPSKISPVAFYKMLGNVLRRPVWSFIPEQCIMALAGEMGKELILEPASGWPSKLIEGGFQFDDLDIKKLFRELND